MSTAPAPLPPPSEATQDKTGHTRTDDIRQHTGTFTRTTVLPGLARGPEVQTIRGVPLNYLLLTGTILLVALVVALLAVLYGASTQRQFNNIGGIYTERIQAQARELGSTLSHTLSLTTASSLRDNNYSFLTEVVKSIRENNANVLRVQIIDPEGNTVADSDEEGELGAAAGRRAERSNTVNTYKGKLAYEYQEPIDYGSSAGKGLVVLTYSLEALQAQLKLLETLKRDTLKTTTMQTVLLGGALILFGGVLAALLARQITRPLQTLAGTALQLAEGQLDARVVATGGAGREVKTLGVVFNHMAERMTWLLEDARARAALEREVALARTVQEALLPSPEPVLVGPVRLAGSVNTADACGGDWWLHARLDDRRMVVGIGDVTGHGLSTALIAASATSGFAAAIRLQEASTVDSARLMRSLNQTLYEVARGEYQMSTALAVIDLEKGSVDFASGAHPSAVVVNRHDGKVSSLLARGHLLGAKPDSTYQSRTAEFRPGDVIVWYTDGVTEAADARGIQYGQQRLLAVVKENVALPADRLRDIVITDVRNFCNGTVQDDDMTVIVAEHQGAAPAGV